MRSEGGMVGRNLERLQREVLGVVSAAQTDRDQAQQGQARLSQELASLREQHKAACQAAAQATVSLFFSHHLHRPLVGCMVRLGQFRILPYCLSLGLGIGS